MSKNPWKRFRFLGYALFTILTLSGSLIYAQPQGTGTIIGLVINAETGEPLENVNVYLALTLLGSASGENGSFRITAVPPGLYLLTASRLGFQKQTIEVQCTEAETLSIAIRCIPQPIPYNGAEVLGKSTNPTAADLNRIPVFFPVASQRIHCVYGTAHSSPVGIMFDDSSLCFISVDIVPTNSQPYLRLWLLYKNTATLPFIIDPLRTVTLRFFHHTLQSDSTLPAGIDSAGVTNAIAENIGTTLHTLAAQERLVLNEREKFFGEQIGGDGILSSGTIYMTFTSSKTDGILKSQPIAGGKSVNGYIYYPLPDWKILTIDESGTILELELKTSAGSTSVSYTSN